MSRRVVLAATILSTVSSVAMAADLPSRVAPPVYAPPVPVFSWTGFYVGGQIGYAFGEDRGLITAPPAAAGGGGFGRPNGLIGGAHVGYNFSTQSLALPVLGGFGASGLIFGVEGDVDGTDYRDPLNTASTALQTVVRSEIQGSARGRIGFAVDRALFYATGGAAFAQFQSTFASPTFYNNLSHTRVGWTVGGGVEYAITTQWSLRAEYRYTDFGTYQDIPFAGAALNRKETMQRAQVGFSYKFDTPVAAPVVARY